MAAAAGLLLALALNLIAIGTLSAAVLVRGLGPEPGSLDPHLAQDLASFNLLFELYEGLVTETPDGHPLPGLAQSWSTSDDGLRWTFLLRPGLVFSDGTPLAAADVVASLRRALDPRLAAPYAAQLAAIAQAEEVLAGRLPPERLGVRAIDAASVEISLATPLPQLPQLLMLPIAFPVHPLLREGGRPDQSPGSGAFMLAARVPQSHLALQANPRYHAADTVKLAGQRLVITEDAHAELNRFRTGELHITETIPPGHYATLRAERGDELEVAPYLGTFWIGYNLTRPPFAGNLALREALSLAVDRRVLVQYLTGAGEQPAWSLVPPGMPGWPAPAHPHAALDDDERLALARQRFADSGYEARSLRVQIRYNSQPLQRRLALAVAAMWRQTLGVQTELHNEEWRVFVVNRRERRLTEAFRGGWIADYADPLSFLDLFRRDSALNATGFDDPAWDAALAQAQGILDPATRAQALAAVEAELMRQQPILPLYFHVSRHLVSSRVRGWTAHPLDRHFGRWLDLAP
jgi:oligopeptide transport system substrate-binding protein